MREHVLLDLAHPWTVRELARIAGVSERTLARRFVHDTGTTPLQWLLTQRVLTAQKLLETSALAVSEVAQRTGFGSALSLRQHFIRHVGLPPREDRLTFKDRNGADDTGHGTRTEK
jgi:transcriptional regulator GlxA family with amidase domain